MNLKLPLIHFGHVKVFTLKLMNTYVSPQQAPHLFVHLKIIKWFIFLNPIGKLHNVSF